MQSNKIAEMHEEIENLSSQIDWLAEENQSSDPLGQTIKLV